ncbi:uncharacterized protein K452DRAFT_272545 [Aplosporella prunicola CBS 121167]|uniref:DUF2264 domain-containing protein n=1 Tax=Aplosporella prunicola CBS 121167 TaxID=1176127 RepID=A0A6A6BD77_9PEZI|nr:uncharacterized protein K452DRAFT_272545 [Aplosporella prunicola CBS 121167]KAF2140857.1 hypothetical protein K452DRAFT_272545 [Aplosporella prunicola CBS 121167]
MASAHLAAEANRPSPAHPLASNPLLTRSDLARACVSLLAPLSAGTSPGGALVRVGHTGTRFDEVAAQVEGYARPLWGLAPLIAGKHGPDIAGSDALVDRYVRGLVSGTDPSGPEFWGWMQDQDQRMVEACPIGFALAVAGDAFWKPLGEQERGNVERWLGSMNEREMPNTNWLWFRVFANLGLAHNGAAHSPSRIEADLAHLDTFYRGRGWSNDGPAGYTQMDYYSSSFAIHYLQLLYAQLAGSRDPVRAAEYRARARTFALDFAYYFDSAGRAITFGRSLTYRFAMAGFWAAIAFSGTELPAPLSWGAVKGLLLRNLRWWAAQPAIFQPNGMLSIGYAYPNPFLAENYNSPGSPYWSMLAFAPLALPPDHPFWACKEEPLPRLGLSPIRPLPLPLQIASSRGGHALLLSSGQSCHYPLRATQAKYAKFAYSAAFAYSVPTGAYTLEQCVPESALAVSDDEGETWKMRRVVEEARIEERSDPDTASTYPVLISTSRPYPSVTITTYLVPPSSQSPYWHTRIHRIRTARALLIAEGGWAIHGASVATGRALGAYDGRTGEGVLVCNPSPATSESSSSSSPAALTSSPLTGASGVLALRHPQTPEKGQMRAAVLAADANSNLVHPRSVLPVLRASLPAGTSAWYVTGVFGLPAGEEGWGERTGTLHHWQEQRPRVPGWVEAMIRADEEEEEAAVGAAAGVGGAEA